MRFKDNDKDTLLKFFKVSNAVFEMKNKVLEAFGGKVVPNQMETLHSLALHELEKEEPNIEFIDHLLELMEVTAEENSKNKTL